MKALSIQPQWAHLVLLEEKNIECRSWKTDYRGDLLICASSRAFKGTISKHALCVVTLADIVPFEKRHLKGACMGEMPEGSDHFWAWKFTNVRMIQPFPVKGKLHLYEVDDGMIHILPAGCSDDESWSWWKQYYQPFFEEDYYFPRRLFYGEVVDEQAWKKRPMDIVKAMPYGYQVWFNIDSGLKTKANKWFKDKQSSPKYGYAAWRATGKECADFLESQEIARPEDREILEKMEKVGLYYVEDY